MSTEVVPSRDRRQDMTLLEGGPLDEDPDVEMHNNIDEMDSALEMMSQRIERLSARIQKTEKQQAEFGRCAQNCTTKLDASILKHINTDQTLAQLVEEDTRRTQEARKEYDILSDLLNDGLRKSSSARMFEVLSGVSIYVGIVLSFVFMAPLHVVRTTGTKLLGRLGLSAVVDVDADSQPHSSLPALPDFTPLSHTDPVDGRGNDGRGTVDAQSGDPMTFSGLRNRNARQSNPEGKESSSSRASQKAGRKPRANSGVGASNSIDNSDEDFVDALSEAHSRVSDSGGQASLNNSSRSTATRPKSESDAGREKRDAGGKVKAREEGDADAKRARKPDAGSRTNRPGWAIPADDDDDEMLTYSKFPSCELVPLQSAELKLDLLDDDSVNLK